MLVPAIHLVYQVCNITQTYRIAAAKPTHMRTSLTLSLSYIVSQNIKSSFSLYVAIQPFSMRLSACVILS